MLPTKVLAVVLGISGIFCWLFPGAIGVLLFHAFQISAHEGMVVGALFFAGALVLSFIEPSDDKRL